MTDEKLLKPGPGDVDKSKAVFAAFPVSTTGKQIAGHWIEVLRKLSEKEEEEAKAEAEKAKK